MGSITFATDKDLKKLKGSFNPHAFTFCIVSQDLDSQWQRKAPTNILDLSELLPPQEIMANVINNDIDRFMENYLGFINQFRADTLSVLIIAAIDKDEDIVLVCSDDEFVDLLYLPALIDITEKEFDIDIPKLKKVLKKEALPDYNEDYPKRARKALDKARDITSRKAAYDKELAKKDKKKDKKKKKKKGKKNKKN